MLFFNANFICYYFYPTKKREEPILLIIVTIMIFWLLRIQIPYDML